MAIHHLSSLQGRTFDAVIFDMDETLIDSGPAIRRSWGTWAKHYGISTEQLAGCQGMPSRQVIETLLPAELVDQAAAHIEYLEVNDAQGIEPLPGALRAFEELPEDRVGIATSCTGALLAVRHASAGLPDLRVMVHRDLVERGKPAPDTVLKAAELLGVDPARTLVVEDAPAGIEGARAARAATLAVATTTPVHQLDADAIVDNLDDVSWLVTADGIRVTPRLD